MNVIYDERLKIYVLRIGVNERSKTAGVLPDIFPPMRSGPRQGCTDFVPKRDINLNSMTSGAAFTPHHPKPIQSLGGV